MNLQTLRKKLIIEDSTYEYVNGPDQYIVPRVSHILSLIHEEYLMRWANGIGFRHKNYEEERSRAAEYGTVTHTAIDAYLNNKKPEETNMAFDGFIYWWDTINKEGNVVEIVAQEETLVCPYYGGTFDLLVKINGWYYLVDFKTSSSVSYKHFLQLAAYRKMLRTLRGIEVDGCIILHLKKDKIAFGEYLVDLHDTNQKYFMDLCEDTFDSLAESYYHVNYVKQVYGVMNFKS